MRQETALDTLGLGILGFRALETQEAGGNSIGAWAPRRLSLTERLGTSAQPLVFERCTICGMHEETSTPLKAKIVGPTEGKEVCAFGNTITFKLSQEDTGGALSLGFSVIPPGNGPPPHVHHSDDEIFVVTKGRFRYTAAGENYECGPGSVVYLPKECPHTFQCISEEPGETIVITTPAGFDRFYERCGEEFATGRPDFAKLGAIAQEHGYEFLTGK